MLSEWTTRLAYGAGLVVALELLYLVLRRSLPRFRLGLLYHLWAVGLGLSLVLHLAGLERSHLLWQLSIAVTVLLSTLVLFLLFNALVLQRPWAPGEPPMLPKLARDVIAMALLVTAGLLVAKEVFDQSLGAILVSSTVLSAVVGLALQDVLKNVFAGMALDIEKPLARGDWLVLDGRDWVQVTDISWRSVRMRTPEGVEISEPNARMAQSRLENYGPGRRPRGLGFRVGLPYEAPPAEVKKALEAAARSVADASEIPPVRVFLESFDEHSIGYYMRVWTRSLGDIRGFQDRVNSRIWYEIKRRGLYVPFPIRTVHVSNAERMAAQSRNADLHRAARLLSEIELFRELDPEVVLELAAAAEHRHFDEGETLVRQGEAGDSLFVIESGSAFVTKEGEGTTEGVQVARLEVGDFFGEWSLLTGEARSATVTSEGGRVLRLAKEAVAAILEQDPKIAEVLSRALAARQAETSATFESHLDKLRQAGESRDEISLLARIRSFFKL